MRTIVTGSGSGIGLCTARALARQPNAHILLVDRNGRRCAANAADLRASGAEVAESAGDLMDPDAPAAIVARAVAAFGGIDGIVSNAGSIAGGADLKDLSPEAFEASFAINTRPAFLLAKSAYPHLKESRGAIVAVASTAARHPVPGLGSYSASKAALVMLIRQLALEWGPDGIRVNCVSPGPTATPMAPVYADPEIRTLRASTLPLRRISEPEDIAETILFLLSSGAVSITGTDLEVDCGMGLTTMLLSGSGLNRAER
jgi:NAD(P)-dependent dehydrogenase (short-subunit alcohol dehydrogenase family)